MPIRKTHRDTGIYRRTTIRAEPYADGRPDDVAMMKVFRAATPTLDEVIGAVEKAALAVLAQYEATLEVGGTFDEPIVEVRSSDKLPYMLPDSFPKGTKPHDIEVAKEAQKAIRWAMSLRTAIERGDVENSAMLAYCLGRSTERLGVLPFEPHAKRGKQVLKSASDGGTKKNREHREKWAAYQADVEAVLTRNKRLSYSAALEIVAKKHGVSITTVKRHTKNHRTKNKK